MVTIKDIASKAGVTSATVSMVLNGKGAISEATRSRVWKIANELGYYPSATAKALRTNKSKTLGLIVGSLRNEFFMDIIYAVEEYASKKGYIIFVCDAERSSRKVVSSLKALAARGVDGILISLGFYPDEEMNVEIERLVADGIKIVSFTSAISLDCVPLVEPTESECFASLASRLAGLGHRKVGLISAPVGSWLHKTRYRIIRNALEAQGIFDDSLVVYSEMNSEAGEECAYSLLSSRPDVTAVVCSNDLVAVGTIRAAERLGLKVPEDISVAGCDGIHLSKLMYPSLTTVMIPRHDMGVMGCRMIIEMVEDDKASFPHKTFIASRLEEGGTLSQADAGRMGK